MLDKEAVSEAVVLHYYMICNDTQEKIRIRQAMTDESIVLSSRACHPYSWRTTRSKQVLQFSVEGMGGMWCNGVNLDMVGTTVHVLENKGHTATLIIKVKEVTGVQKQVSG